MAASAAVPVDTSANGEENQTEREVVMMMMKQATETNAVMVRRRPCSPRSHCWLCSARMRFDCTRLKLFVIRPPSQARTHTPACDQHALASAHTRAPRPTHLHKLLCILACMRRGGWWARSTSCARSPSHLGLHAILSLAHTSTFFARCTAKSSTSTPLLSTPPRAGSGGGQA